MYDKIIRKCSKTDGKRAYQNRLIYAFVYVRAYWETRTIDFLRKVPMTYKNYFGCIILDKFLRKHGVGLKTEKPFMFQNLTLITRLLIVFFFQFSFSELAKLSDRIEQQL